MKNTTLCYIEKDNSYLMLHRVKKVNDMNQDKWIGVGGKLEEGESPEECVLREVKEETGLDIENPILCGVKQYQGIDDERCVVMFYKTNKFSGELQSSHEGKVFWIPREKLGEYQLAEDMEEMVKVFETDTLSEFYYHKEKGKWEFDLY